MRIILPLLSFVLLIACAPEAPDPGRLEIQQLAERPTYYPRQTGMVWNYLRDSERLDAPPVLQQVLGPTVVGGEVLIATRLYGRGLDTSYFRRYAPEGVFLVRETRPGAVIDFDPPRQEMPAENALSTGASWGGSTTARLFFSQARPENQHAELRLDYEYQVVDRREVVVAAGRFEVFVINLVANHYSEDGVLVESVQQEGWFAPYVGEVRTPTGYYLVSTNFAHD